MTDYLISDLIVRDLPRARSVSVSRSMLGKAVPVPMPVHIAGELDERFGPVAEKRSSKKKSKSKSRKNRSSDRRVEGSPPGGRRGTHRRDRGDSLPFEPDFTQKVADPTVYPYSAVSKMFFEDAIGRSYVGSAWIVGPRAFVTAAHCVWDDSEGELFRNIVAVPAFQGPGDDGFGATRVAVHPGYIDSAGRQSCYDLAVFTVDENVANEFGSLGFDASGNITGDKVEAIGFPANPRPIRGEADPEVFAFDGNSMWHSVGDSTGTDGDIHSAENEMTGGCSGGAWVEEGTSIAIGLNSFRLVPHDNRMFSPVFDDDFMLLINWLRQQGEL